jgi:hypothetical protein
VKNTARTSADFGFLPIHDLLDRSRDQNRAADLALTG